MRLESIKTKSGFGARLYDLIVEKNLQAASDNDRIKTVKGLARKLFDLDLVHVKPTTKETYNDPAVDYNNAIGSIEKTIWRHINTGKLQDQKGEMILAYCKFFQCSSDYIYGLTDIRNPNVEVRRICEMTGLSETAVTRLVDSNKDFQYERVGIWSGLLSSDLFYSIPADYDILANVLIDEAENTLALAGKKWEKENVENIEEYPFDYNIKQLEKSVKSCQAAFYGQLSKLSRDIEDYFEKLVRRGYGSGKEGMTREWIERLKTFYRTQS